MVRVKQFADDLAISKKQAKDLINKGRNRKDGGSQILESVMSDTDKKKKKKKDEMEYTTAEFRIDMIPEKDRESFYTYDDLPMHEVPDLHKEGYLAKKDFSGVEYKEHEEYKKLCKMTIEEFKKICSFPSDYYLDGSYNQQLERLGRSVPPLLLKAVARNIYYKILKPYNEQ